MSVWPKGSNQSGYQTAAICPEGHVATSDLELSPDLAGKYCKECGGAILTKCPSCGNRIRGFYHVPGVLTLAPYYPPNYCEDCGGAFPWVTARLKVATELTDELAISEDERVKIKESLRDITRNTPGMSIAVIRLKKLLGNARDTVGQALWKITIDLATEAAKKTLLGQ